MRAALEAQTPWENCLYSAEEERDFVRDHLGPRLTADGLGHLRTDIGIYIYIYTYIYRNF